MEGSWKFWEGKKVFIILKNRRTYQGVVTNIDEGEHLVWITIKDKFDNSIIFVNSEMEVMQEE